MAKLTAQEKLEQDVKRTIRALATQRDKLVAVAESLQADLDDMRSRKRATEGSIQSLNVAMESLACLFTEDYEDMET